VKWLLVRERGSNWKISSSTSIPQVWQWPRRANALALLKCRASISTSGHNANGDPNYRSTTRDVRRLLEKWKLKRRWICIWTLRNNWRVLTPGSD